MQLDGRHWTWSDCNGKMKMDRETGGKEGNPEASENGLVEEMSTTPPVFHHMPYGTGHFKIFINVTIIQSHCL